MNPDAVGVIFGGNIIFISLMFYVRFLLPPAWNSLMASSNQRSFQQLTHKKRMYNVAGIMSLTL